VSWRARTALAACALALGACQTARSFDGGCPGVYSGVRYYADQVGELPADGVIFFTLDLPLSAVFDTLLLPVTPFAETERPRYGWLPGCRWAED